MTYRELLKQGVETLKNAGIREYDTDALELLLFLKNWTKTDFLLEREGTATEEERRKLSSWFLTRASRVPLQHITGEAWFYGRRFAVGPEVLIPRFDTEILVSEALGCMKNTDVSVLDLCTGSGCVAVTLKLEGGYRRVAASDLSPAALRTAEANANALGAEVEFFESDLFGNIPERFDMIVSNPPYISAEELQGLEPEVRLHDPEMALSGGPDGLLFYRRIAAESPAHLVKYGRILLETGAGQADAVSGLLSDAGFSGIRTIKDLAGLDRVVAGTYTGE